ncbi:hypothetical protein AYO50_00315 [Acidobacteria bacterium SCGC AG-212-P17]|nr:hypothetical protein AYO50_00315 [Acidobacteria bacterium SCGC AG-212-P17]
MYWSCPDCEALRQIDGNQCHSVRFEFEQVRHNLLKHAHDVRVRPDYLFGAQRAGVSADDGGNEERRSGGAGPWLRGVGRSRSSHA